MSFFQAPVVGTLKDRQYTGEVFSAGSLTNEQLATITSSQITSSQKDFSPSIWSLNAGQNPGSPQRLNNQSSLRRGGHRRAYSDGPWAISAVWPPADEFSALGSNFEGSLQGDDGFSQPNVAGSKMGWGSSNVLAQAANLNRGEGLGPGSTSLNNPTGQNAHSRSESTAQMATKSGRSDKPSSPNQPPNQHKLTTSLSARLSMVPIQEAGPQIDSTGQSSCNTSCADMQDAPPGVDSDDLMMLNSLEVPDFSEFGLGDDLGLGDQECKWQDAVLDEAGDQMTSSERRREQHRTMRRSNSSCTRRDIALLDPKVFKRMMANRESAARSKAKKTAMLNTLKEKVAYYQQEQSRLEDERKALLDDSAVLSRYRMDMSSQAAGLEFQLTNAQMGTSELRSQLMNLQRSLDLPLIEPSVPEDDVLELPPLPELHSALLPRYNGRQNLQRRPVVDGGMTASTPAHIDSDHCMQRRMSLENPFQGQGNTPFPNGNNMPHSPFDTPTSATSSSRTTPAGTEPATPRGFNSPPFLNTPTSQAQIMQTLQGLATRRRSSSMESMLSSAQQQPQSLAMESQHFTHLSGSHRKLASWDSILAGPNGGLDGLPGSSRGPERALSTGASWDAMLSTPGSDGRHVVTSGAEMCRPPHIGSAPRFASSHSLPMDHNMESDVWHPQWHSGPGRGGQDQALTVANL